jgi:hypothetical protein
MLLADDDVDDVNDINDTNDADHTKTNDKRSKKKKRSRLDTSLDRVEWFVMWYFFASLTVSQAKFINEFALLKIDIEMNISLLY